MKILILSPPNSINPETGGSTMDNRMMPLDLAIIASVISKGHHVRILDALALGLSKPQIIKEIEASNPDLLLISPFDRCRWAQDAAMEIIKDTRVPKLGLIGGYNPDFIRRFMELEPKIDFSTYGDPEETLQEIARTGKSSGIQGTLYRSSGKVVQAEPRDYLDIDKLPIPDRSLLDIGSYVRFPHENKSVKSMDIIVSRGCPYRCSYCLVKQLYGRKFRLRSPENIATEIKTLIKDYRIKEFSFMDSTFTLDSSWLERLAELIKPLGIEWQCQTRVDLVNNDLLRKMKESGCFSILYGVESLEPELLKNIRKGVTPDQIRKAVRMTKKAGIESRLSVMFGLPGETPEMVERMIDSVIDLDPEFVQFHSLVVFPGTDMEFDIKSNDWGRLDSEVELKKYDIVGLPFIPHGYSSRSQIEAMRKRAYKKFYLRPRYIARLMTRPTTLFRYLRAFRIFIRLLRE